jgi:peptidoglycan/LPS O-acetylase OafA/YrhL
VWVVLYHYQADIYSLFPATVSLRPFFNLGNLAVPLFFILSGFVLSYNYANDFRRLEIKSCRKFILNRLARIYPVHFATLLAVLLMVSAGKILGLQSGDVGHSPRDFVLNLFLVQTWVPHFRLNWNFPSWSISSEWFAYLWFPIVAIALNKVTRRIWLVLMAAGFFCLMQFQVIFGNALLFRELQVVVGTFLTGCAIFKLIQHGAFKQRPAYYLSISALALVFIVPFLLRNSILLATLLTLFAILIYSLAGLGDKCQRLFIAPLLVFVGEVSYSLYMTHTLLQRILYKLLPASAVLGSNLLVRLGVLCLYAILISLATLASYYVVEKPFRKLLRSRLQRETPASQKTGYAVMEIGVPEMIESGNL